MAKDDPGRAERLAQALRTNLARRKRQARARDDGEPTIVDAEAVRPERD